MSDMKMSPNRSNSGESSLISVNLVYKDFCLILAPYNGLVKSENSVNLVNVGLTST